MEIVGALLMIVGVLLALVYNIILIVKAFQTSILWGLGYFFIPFVNIIFVIIHWEIAKKPFLMSLLAIPLLIGGALLMPGFTEAMSEAAQQPIPQP